MTNIATPFLTPSEYWLQQKHKMETKWRSPNRKQIESNLSQMEMIICSCAGCSYPDGRLFWPRWQSFGTQAFAVKQSWDQGGFNFLLAKLVALVGRSPQICTVAKMGCQNQIDLYRWLLRLI